MILCEYDSLIDPSFHTHLPFPLTPHTIQKCQKSVPALPSLSHRSLSVDDPAGRIPLLQKLYAGPQLFSGLGKNNPTKTCQPAGWAPKLFNITQ